MSSHARLELDRRRADAARRRAYQSRPQNIVTLLQNRQLGHPDGGDARSSQRALDHWLQAASFEDGADTTPAPACGGRSIGLRDCYVKTLTNYSTAQEALDPTKAFAANHDSFENAHDAVSPSSQPSSARGPHGRKSTLCMDQSPTGMELSSGHSDHHIRVWSINPTESKLRWTLRGHTRTPCTVHYHPLLPHLLASGDLAGEVFLWCTHRGVRLASYDFRRSGSLRTTDRIASLSWYPSQEQVCLAIAHRKLCFFWIVHAEEDGEEEDEMKETQQFVHDNVEDVPALEEHKSESMDLDGHRPLLQPTYQGRKRSLVSMLSHNNKLKKETGKKRAKVTVGAAASCSSAPPLPHVAASSLEQWFHLSSQIASTLQSICEASPSHTRGKPIAMLKARLAWRYVHFHATGGMLMVAERSGSDKTHDGILGGAVAAKTKEEEEEGGRSSLALRIYSLDPSRFILHPSSRKHEMHALAVVQRLLFFSESGIAVENEKFTTCQWYAPPTSFIGEPANAPFYADNEMVPTLAVFDLRVGHVGEVLMRLELSSTSFSDLTCVAFSPSPAQYIAVAYQITHSRTARRMRRLERSRQLKEATQQQGSLLLPQPQMQLSSRGGARNSRFSALTALTRAEQSPALASGTASAPSSSSSFPPLVPDREQFQSETLQQTRYRPSESYATQSSQSLDDHAFLCIYRTSDLQLVRQLVVNPSGHRMSISESHSVNAVVWSQQAAVGLMAGVTSGDIMVCSPITMTIDDGGERVAAPQEAELEGRHRLPQHPPNVSAPASMLQEEALEGDL